MKQALFVLSLVAAAWGLISCTKDQDSAAVQRADRSAEPKPFRGQVYTSFDRRTVMTMVSADELEIAKDGVNLVHKYSRQDDVVRVVVNTFGSMQAVYYRIIADGLRDSEGRVFYTPTGLEEAEHRAEVAKAQTLEEARLLAERQEQEGRRMFANVLANGRQFLVVRGAMRRAPQLRSLTMGRFQESMPMATNTRVRGRSTSIG